MTFDFKAAFHSIYDRLPEELREDYEDIELEPEACIVSWDHGISSISLMTRSDGQIEMNYNIDAYGSSYVTVADPTEEQILTFLDGATAYLMKVNDPWSSNEEFGYADWGTTIGEDTWEDQAGMVELKAYLKIPDDWYLTKTVNFGGVGRMLSDIEAWLASTCMGEYKRVGWSSGCSTKVGIAFENPHDAFFYKLRWR